MALKRCRKCGLPLRLSRGYAWPGNGAILARNDSFMRMVLFEADYYPYMWSRLEELLGVSMAEAMIRGQSAANRDYLESNILYGWRRYVLPYMPMRMLFRRLQSETALFGFAEVELLEYRRKRFTTIRVKHPFDIISVAWGIKGLAECREGMSSELAWRVEGEDCVLSISFREHDDRGESADLEPMRLIRDAKRELSHGGNPRPPSRRDEGEPCPACGLPRALTELEWREADGTIRRRDGGRRYIFTSAHVFVGVVRDLEVRTGRDLQPVIMDISREFHLRALQGIDIRTRSGAYRAAARYLFAGGFGSVTSFNCGEGYLEMLIANPLFVPRLVGRIAGLFEYIEGEDADISFRRPEPQLLELEIRAT